MSRFLSKSFLAGLAGGLLGYVALSLLGINTFGLGNLYSQNLDKDTDSALLSSVSVPSSLDESWESIASKTALSSVGIQVFRDNKLVRQGSGLAVSSDGLIATVSDLAIANAVYQIFYDDKIIKANIMAVDYGSNLMLLRSAVNFAGVSDFNPLFDYQSGQDVLITGKIIDLSKPVLATQRGLIKFTTEKQVTIDGVASNYLSGFGIVTSDGRIIGVSYLRNGQINLVRANALKRFLDDYLGKNK